jgi:hypothetical protein
MVAFIPQVDITKNNMKEIKFDNDFKLGKATHRNLGVVEITEACLFMQDCNPDASTLYVEHDGDIKEVSHNMMIPQSK